MNSLRPLRVKKGVYQKDVAEYLGVDRTTYVKYERGDSEPNIEILKKLATYFDVSMDELMGIENSYNSFSNIFPIQKKRFPLLGEIACGQPIFADEDKESYVESGTDIKADFCLKAKGDSMINARIMDGDIVFIRKQPIVENGEIAAVIIEDDATLKRVYYNKKAGILQLVAENPAYPPLVYSGEELNHIRILGKAVAFQSDIR